MPEPQFRPRRSALYMPGANARALEKAREIDADVLIFDLEDSVAPEAKAEARAMVAAALAAGGFGRRERVVRINPLNGPWGAEDLRAVLAAGPEAILVPKVSAPETLAAAQAALGTSPVALWAMLETPAAMLAAGPICRARATGAANLAAVVMGTNDLAKEMRARLLPGRAAYLPWLANCLAAARAGGVDILDGVFNDLDDAEGFAAECRQGRDIGFDGKTLIHPRQVAPCNAAFGPDAQELGWARAIAGLFELPEHRGLGVVRFRGRMVERLHAEMAQRVVALAEAGQTGRDKGEEHGPD